MSGMITRDDAVEVCQSYGFSTADGWSDSKVQKKLRELIQLFRSGDWEPDSDDDEDGKLLELMQQMANATKDGEEAVIRTKEEIDEEDAAEKEAVEGCPVSVGDRGIVVESDGITWKGMVKKLLNPTHALIMDQDGETWDVDVSSFEVKLKAADVKKKKKKRSSSREEQSPKEKRTRRVPKDDEDEELRDLRERIKALKSKKKGKRKAGGKKPSRKGQVLKRDAIAVKLLQRTGGGSIDQLAKEADKQWEGQGRQGNMRASIRIMGQMVRAGVLFGVLKQSGQKVEWIETE